MKSNKGITLPNLDKAIIELYNKKYNPFTDLPYTRLILEKVGGLSKEETDKILLKIKPEDLVKIHSDDGQQ